MEYLLNGIALVISILTAYNIWLATVEKKLRIEKLRLERRRKRRGG